MSARPQDSPKERTQDQRGQQVGERPQEQVQQPHRERLPGAREQSARAVPAPLRDDEWPPALLISIAVCALLASGVLVGVLTERHLAEHGGSVPGGIFIAALLSALALGMYRRRYWAAIAFQALLAFQIIIACLLLLLLGNLIAIAVCLLAIALGGTLFWKLVRVMGRIQARDLQRRHLAIAAAEEEHSRRDDQAPPPRQRVQAAGLSARLDSPASRGPRPRKRRRDA